MNIKNRCIQGLVHALNFLRQWKKKKTVSSTESHRFLVVSTTGLGDTLWGTPALKALRANFPDAYIAVLTSEIGREVLKYNRHVDDLFVIKKQTLFSLIHLYFSVWKKKIHTALIFHTSQRPILPFCFLIGAQEIIGTEGINKGLDFLLTQALENKPMHEIARRMEIVRRVGACSLDSLIELFTSEEDEKQAIAFLEKHQVLPYLPLIGIHPGAKDKFKQWDPECFIEVGNRLVQHLGCQIFVTGNQSEKELVEQVSSQIPGAISVYGQLPLRSLAGLIKKMSLMIVNDTGPMHMAFAMHTPTVALFTPTDPKLCGPYFATRAQIIEKKKTCTPCLKKKCHEPFCLLQISPDEVYEASLNLFYRGDCKTRFGNQNGT